MTKTPQQVTGNGVRSVLFDIDGTLIDSNDQHAQSWCDVFTEQGTPIAFDRIRPLIGMGGDKLLDSLDVALDDSGTRETLSARRREVFLTQYLAQVTPFADASALVLAFKRSGLHCVVASSASPEELEPLLALAGLSDAFDHVVKPDDIERTKPDPDIVDAALAATGTLAEHAVFIGDTKYDVEAGHRRGVRCIAFRSGGSTDAALAEADKIFDSPAALLAALQSATLDELI